MRRFRSYGISAISFFVGASAVLAVAQNIHMTITSGDIDHFSRDLMDHSITVAKENRKYSRYKSDLNRDTCTDSDLNLFRSWVFGSEYVSDIGKISRGKILCTAIWGNLTTPKDLPTFHYELGSGYKLWRDVPNPVYPSIRSDISAIDSIVTFTAPYAFHYFENDSTLPPALVQTNNHKYIYRSFGDTSQLQRQVTWPATLFSHIITRCANDPDICVTTGRSKITLFDLDSNELGTILALAFAIGLMTSAIAHLLSRERNTIDAKVQRAISKSKIKVLYQPIIDARDGRFLGMEALSRVVDDGGEYLSPDDFVPYLEKTGRISILTKLVISNSLNEMGDFLKKSGNIYMSLNLSAAEVLSDVMYSFVVSEVKRHNIPPEKITIELTERSTSNAVDLADAVDRFRSHGFGFYIDDFGTGYSNLSYLAKLPVTGIKADKLFTGAIGTNSISSSFVLKMSDAATSMGIKLVIEGVETKEQVAYISHITGDIGCQGFYFSEPIEKEILLRHLNSLDGRVYWNSV